MMKIVSYKIIVILSISFLMSCGKEDSVPKAPPVEAVKSVDPTVPIHSNEELLELYAGIAKGEWAETSGPEFSPTHWDYYFRNFINQDVEVFKENYNKVAEEMELRELGEDIDVEYIEYKPGTIIAKEHMDEEYDKKSQMGTLMIKERPGYDTDAGDWRYVEIRSGKIILDGNSQNHKVFKRCVDCHANVKNRNYIYNNYFNKKLSLTAK